MYIAYIYIDTYGIRNFLVILQSTVLVVSVVSGQGCLLAKELDASKNFINHTALKMLLTVLKEIGGKFWSRNMGLVGGLEYGFYDFHFILMGCHPNPIDELIFFKMVIAPPTRGGFCGRHGDVDGQNWCGVISSNFAVLSRSIRDLTLHLWRLLGATRLAGSGLRVWWGCGSSWTRIGTKVWCVKGLLEFHGV